MSMDATQARRRAEEVNRRYHQHRNAGRFLAAVRFALLPSLVATIPGAGVSFCLALQAATTNPALALQSVAGGAIIAATVVGLLALLVGLVNEMQKPD